MKGLSIILTALLFVVAAELAQQLKRAGVLPAQKQAGEPANDAVYSQAARMTQSFHPFENN
jgi:hypothetical protein